MNQFSRHLAAGVFVAISALFAAAAPPETLTARDLANRPDRWPSEVAIANELDFGDFVVKAGDVAKVIGFNGRDVELALPGDVFIRVSVEDCDLVEAANRAWAMLTPEQRAVDERQILDDASLWPETIKSGMAFEFDNGITLPAGHEYKLVWVGRDGIRAFDDEKRLQVVLPIGQSDLFTRAREIAATPRSERPSRLVELLRNKVVDADGNPLDPSTFDDSDVFALYYAASWCGYCREFNPEFIRAIERARAQYPKLAVILISIDEDPAKMFGYMKSGQVPWPAVSHETMKASAWLSGLYGGGVPQLVIVDRYGKVEATSTEMRRSQVLQTLPRVLRSHATKE